MLRALQYSLVCACVMLTAMDSRAFSLLGPLDAYANLPANAGQNWPIPRIGYNVFNTDIGVPVNLGEEYRWNVRTVTYAYDQSFLNYFGQHGVDALEGAIRILNELPPVSEINLDDYPTDNTRLNGTAQSLLIMDIKSTALSLLLEVFGLAAPERFVFTLRDRATPSIGGTTITNYVVIQRNFDPVTLQPTNRVNGAAYDYVIFERERPQDWADAREFRLDTLEFGYSSVAGALSSPIYNAEFESGVIEATGLLPGEFFPGLTRDDVGGWRYLLRRPNWNVEQMPPNTGPDLGRSGTVATNNAGPWTPIFVATNIAIFTNTFGTNPPWTPFVPGTNVVTNIFGTNITNLFVDIALRPGPEKIVFRRVNFDSLLGQSFNFTNRWTDTVISNFTRTTQKLQRVQTQPDLLFGAADLGTFNNAEGPVLLSRGVTRVNNDALNGFTAQGGPGVLQGPVTILFSDVLRAFEHSGSSLSPTITWGSFDERSDNVIVFPNGLSLEDLEEIINQRGR
jgi:hypothetical protein